MGGSVGSAIGSVGNAVGGAVGGVTRGVGGIFGGPNGGLFGNTGGGEGGVHFDQGSQPIRPTYQTITDPNSPGKLQGGYNLTPGADVQQDMTGYNAIKDRATAAPGTSAWGNLMRQQNQSNLSNSQNNLASQEANSLAQAKSQLANQRGLSSGASERLATNAQRDKLMANQGLQNQANQQNLGIGINEANQQNTAQNQLAQDSLQNANFQQGQRAFDTGANEFNIKNAIGEHQNENLQNLSAYQAQLGQWAGAGQANAMSAANNRGKK